MPITATGAPDDDDELATHVVLASPVAESVEMLMTQAFEPDRARGTVGDVLRHASSKQQLGETIVIARFGRWTVE